MAVEIIVVGASLGGFQALQHLLGALPRELSPPIALVQHRRAEPSPLAHLLGTKSQLPVSEPEDRTAIEAGHVYVAPPDYHLLVERGHFALSCDEPVSCARPSIDVLFESAAQAYGASVIGVLLTGANEDGAAGIRCIAKMGGVTVVEDPGTAESPVAPAAAIAMTKVDHVLPLEKIAPLLATLSAAKDVPTRRHPRRGGADAR